MIPGMATTTTGSTKRSAAGAAGITRIAAGVDGFPEGEDAVALGMALARATAAELMLVAVQSEPLVLPPPWVNWTSSLKLRRLARLG
jgi:hypothetical protein